jgi:prepilin-type processing-associated H-X9-DG protein
LVVIAVVAVLLAILLPALGRVREQARRTKCAGHIRQQLIALTVYGAQNEGELPTAANANVDGAVGCDAVNFMLRSGMTRPMFYCPSNASHQKYNDYLWIDGFPEHNFSGWDGSHFTKPGGIQSSYSWLMYGSHNFARWKEITPYARDSLKKTWARSLNDSHPASKELVTDMIWGIHVRTAQYLLPGVSKRYGLNFVETDGVFDPGMPDRNTNHLAGMDPSGSNIGFLDGHSEWRPFNPDIDPNGIAVARWSWSSSSKTGYFW